MARTLYICYFGVCEPLVQTQVIPYLLGIAKDGHNISLLTFEPDLKKKWTAEQIEAEKKKLAEKGIEWHWLAYHKRFSAIATAYDVFRGALSIRRIIREEKIDILHGRVHVPTLMGALARKFSKQKPKLLFDIRGFFPEEYTDAGIWPEGGWLYRSAKWVEKWLMKEADGFVVLTEKARDILFPETNVDLPPRPSATPPKQGGEFETLAVERHGRPVAVIPCCVDIGRFSGRMSREDARRKLGVENRFVAAYVGSFGGWYLTAEMMDFFEAAREFDQRAFVLILTQRNKDAVAAALHERGFADMDFLVESVKPDQLAEYLVAADVAVSFIKACYSKLSSSPTKIAEYLACGVPIIANPGVGDVDALVENNGVGALIRDFSSASYLRALADVKALGDVRDHCRQTAFRDFDLGRVGGARYRLLYNTILGEKNGR